MSLKEMRQAAGFTQRELAEATGIHLSVISRIECEVVSIENITFKSAMAIADALGITPKELLENARIRGK